LTQEISPLSDSNFLAHLFRRRTAPQPPLLLQGEEPRLGVFVHRVLASRLLDPDESGSSCLIVCGDNVFRHDIVVQETRSAATDPQKVLARIRISRAVTVHQFHTLVVSRLEDEIEKFRTSLILLSGILPLFSDGAVSERESLALLAPVMTAIRGIALRSGIPCILPADRREALRDARSRRLFSLLESLTQASKLPDPPPTWQPAFRRRSGKLFADQKL